MIRTIGILAALAFCIVLIALGGQIGPVYLTEVRRAMFAFAGVTAFVLLGLRAI